MIYSTTRCPHCNNIVRKETNPVHEIACPFEQCPFCEKIYLNRYKEEWITKSPIKRVLYFVQNGVLARAFIFSLLIAGVLGSLLASEDGSPIFLMWIIIFVIWIIVSYSLRKEKIKVFIDESLERTKSSDYIEALKKANYEIFPIEGFETEKH
ncbi:MAG: hypothetical protein WC366_05405 [Bacilli bacterium]|jgi:phage FluMu protein Com